MMVTMCLSELISHFILGKATEETSSSRLMLNGFVYLCCRHPEAESCGRRSRGHQGRDDRKVPGYEQKGAPLWISKCLYFVTKVLL